MGYVKGVSHLLCFIFYFYVNDVLIDIPNLLLGCELSDYRVNILCYADDIALQAPTENALKYMLDTLAPKLEKFSFEINVEKSSNAVL